MSKPNAYNSSPPPVVMQEKKAAMTADVTVPHKEDSYYGTNSFDNESCIGEEQIEHAPEATASPGKALFMLLKAFIGTGVIFLPGSFVSGGLVFSICLMVFIATICLFSFHILVQTQQSVGGSYGDVAAVLYGRWVRYLIQFFLCLSQMGFVASYLIFISQNIDLAAQTLSSCTSPIESKYYIWIVLVVIIPITWVRKIAKLSYLAMFADIFILFGLICVVYFTASQINTNGVGPNIRLINPNDFALMIGTAVFSFEGIGMVVPIVEGMKEPKKFPMVLTVGMIICTVVFTFIGTIGYIAYGENTQASVVSNFPRVRLAIAVQLLYALAMIMSSPFMLYPPLTIVERGIFGTNRSGKVSLRYKWLKNLTRSIIPIICAAVSFGVGSSGLDKFVSLVGSIACMPLCFIFPGLFHYKVTTSKVAKAFDVVLVIWGWGIMIYTLYVNINSWVHPSSSSSAAAAACTPLEY